MLLSCVRSLKAILSLEATFLNFRQLQYCKKVFCKFYIEHLEDMLASGLVIYVHNLTLTTGSDFYHKIIFSAKNGEK
jgi:hypothetical protein